MLTKPITYIHLGLPKTGTTCLQEYLFSRHSQIHYFGKYVNGGFPPAICNMIIDKNAKGLETEPADIRMQSIPKQLNYAAENGLVPVLSKEGFAGGPIRLKRKQLDSFSQNLGPVKAILVIREPVSFIKSYYTQVLKGFNRRSGTKRPRWMKQIGEPPAYFDINHWMETVWRNRNSPRNMLSCAKTASLYRAALGKDHVQVLLFEDFVQNAALFVGNLCDSMGINSAEGIRLVSGKRANDRLTMGYVRRLQEIEQSPSLKEQFQKASASERHTMLDPATSGEKFVPELSERWIREIRKFSRRQNRRLAKEWNLPLADHGYIL